MIDRRSMLAGTAATVAVAALPTTASVTSRMTDPDMAEFAADLQAAPLPVRIAIGQLMRGMVTGDPDMMLTAADKLDCRGEVEAYIERRGSRLA
ncbi:hypothetical protein SAMN02982917_1626 [Azospirillum oryzae]|uniref:Uncharacterized protein n=1 Tax=Azospirillum oryzae TaxID=286727 RepID=A0A1X7EFH6_9PROT|nr:hypothetical protein [Azospirillum oryzae]SMF33012.1 hypothetical protein SAMN02982917_1626 [Azospirillum oryzae]